MFSAKIKSIAILFLSVLAILQTSQLWFENFSNRNFFYTLLPQLFSVPQAGQPELYKNMLSRVIINFGGDFSISYYGEDASDRAVSNLLRKGSFVSVSELDWQEALKSRSVIYEYPTAMPSAALVKAYGVKSSAVASKVKNISYVVIIPNRTNNEQLKALFIDEKAGQQYEYSVEGTDLNEPLQNQIRSAQDNIGQFFYISSVQSGFESFRQNTFIPKWREDAYRYVSATPYNPYSENSGTPLLYAVEKKIDTFFDNPILKDALPINGIYTYSTETILVKYRPSSVLEYYSYRPVSQKTVSDYYSSFDAAIRFLSKDVSILNDLYLSDAEASGDGWIFYFDYTINNFPVFLSEEIMEETDLKHSIEITVERGEVKQYKRYVCAFLTENNAEISATADFLSVINGAMENYPRDTEIFIEDLSLGYRIEKDSVMTLFWFLEINGSKYVKGAE